MLKPPEKIVSRKQPSSVGLRGQGMGCGATGALWEIAQEGGLLGRSCEKGGVQEKSQNQAEAGM